MKIINKENHINLIQDEQIYRFNEFEKLLNKNAAKMYVDNELYLCRYEGFDELAGNIIVKFEHNKCYPPRRNEILHCFVSPFQNDNVINWGGLTYKQLRTKVETQFESKTVFFKYNNDHTIVGLSGVKPEDVEKYKKDVLIFLAPSDPPLEYLVNLVDYLKQTPPDSNRVLNLQDTSQSWNPIPLVVDDNIVSRLQADFATADTIIIQGPPGTGKTYLMAHLCASLLLSDYKILVTALTNRALMEVVEKKFLKSALGQGKIYKTALTAEESKNKKAKGLIPFKSLSKQKPPMLLASYYVMSQLAIKSVEGDHFDYIIIEEASQAYLSTIAIAKKLGKKLIVIGDINQLEPIFHKELVADDKTNHHLMVCGLKSISFYLQNSKQYILTDSYRLTPNAIRTTNFFYDGKLKSKSNADLPIDFSDCSLLNKYFDKKGGSTLIKFEPANGRNPSSECMTFIIESINQIKLLNPKTEIAVLSFYKDSVRFLQKEIYKKCNNTDELLVETIDRIQGLTTDFCFVFIPTESIPFSLQMNRFNVATSRSRLCTVLLGDKDISEFYGLVNLQVSTFLNDIPTFEYQRNHSELVDLETNEINDNTIGIKVVGYIDPSTFEKRKREIKPDKENIYIIDTNVFIDCPEIISKIDKKYKIVLSAKVIDELDNLKLSLTEELKINVSRALKLINNSIEKRNIKMDTADLSLIPQDFNKKSPDNYILSVALKYRDANPIMLTSDHALQIKSKGFGVSTISLKDFLKQIRG